MVKKKKLDLLHDPLIVKGLENLTSFLPEVVKGSTSSPSKAQHYPLPELVPHLDTVWTLNIPELWNEVFILLIRHNLHLPKWLWIDIARHFESGKVDFPRIHEVYPEDAQLPQDPLGITSPPRGDAIPEKINVFRYLMHHYQMNSEIREDLLFEVWKKAQPHPQVAQWLAKLPQDIVLPWANLLTKRKTKKSLLAIRLWATRQPDWLTDLQAQVNARPLSETFKVKLSEDLTYSLHLEEALSLLPFALIETEARTEIWQNFNHDIEVVNACIQASLDHHHLVVALHQLERSTMHWDDLHFDALTLNADLLAKWITSLLTLPKYPVNAIYQALSSSSAYWNPALSEKVAKLITWGLINESEDKVWSDLLKLTQVKAHPSILQHFIHFKETNPYLSTSTKKLIGRVISVLHLRLTIRRTLQKRG